MVEQGGRAYNVTTWIEDNKQFFLPPVCNKMILLQQKVPGVVQTHICSYGSRHKEGQMKHFFVGGPNERKDFHIDCGEELFYQVKGDMVLKIVEKSTHKDIHIKQGQMFLLPARLPHSPQRFEDTVGLVVERDRHQTELDGLRYFTEKDGELTQAPLFEKWFYCEDLGSQLGPIIKEFFQSEQYKTGKPTPGTIPEEPPVDLDTETEVEAPFYFQEWIERKRQDIDKLGRVSVFDDKYQFRVFMYGKGENKDHIKTAESWIWQWEGSSRLCMGEEEHALSKDDSYLIPMDTPFTVKQEAGSLALVCYQDPTVAPTWPAEGKQ